MVKHVQNIFIAVNPCYKKFTVVLQQNKIDGLMTNIATKYQLFKQC